MSQFISFDKILLAMKETFYYDVKLTKQNNNSQLYVRHKNLLFDLEINETTMNLSTGFLSPCMYINNIIDPYVKNNNGDYVIEEIGIFCDETKNCIKFSSDKIPIDYLIMSKLFSFLKKTNPNNCVNVKNFDIIIKNEINTLRYENNKDKLKNIEYKKCWSDFMNYNGKFTVHNKNWITSDVGCARYHKDKSVSDFTQKIFDKINASIKNCNLLPNNKPLKYHGEISTIAKFQGGINLFPFFTSFGYSHLFDPHDKNYGELFIRCNGKCSQLNTNTDNRWNNYYCDESDFQSVTILNEFIKSEGIKTTLICDSKIDTTKNDDILFISDDSVFYPIVKYFRDIIC